MTMKPSVDSASNAAVISYQLIFLKEKKTLTSVLVSQKALLGYIDTSVLSLPEQVTCTPVQSEREERKKKKKETGKERKQKKEKAQKINFPLTRI